MQITGELKSVSAKAVMTESAEWMPSLSFKIECEHQDELFADAMLMTGTAVIVKVGDKINFDAELSGASSRVKVEEVEGDAPIHTRLLTVALVAPYEAALFKKLGCLMLPALEIEILPKQVGLELAQGAA